jgi:hypothetical protein
MGVRFVSGKGPFRLAVCGVTSRVLLSSNAAALT